MLLLAVVAFFLHLGDVNQNRRMIFSRQGSRILQRLLRAGINRVRSWRCLNERVSLPLLQEFFRVREHLRFAFIVRRRKIDERFSQHAAHTGGLRFLRNRVLEVIHIRESGHTRANLFRGRQPRSPTYKIFIHVLRFRGKNVLAQPVIERHIVMQPAKQRHGHVRVPIDEPGQDQPAVRINRLRGVIFSIDLRSRPNRGNGITAHGNAAVVDD